MNQQSSGGAAFVAGATGFTGKAVVKELVERGVTTIAHVRPDSPRLAEWRERFEQMGAEVDATAWEDEAMAETLARVRPGSVFALLGTLRSRMKAVKQAGGDPRSASYHAIDYGLTATLIRAAVKAGSSPRFVYLSAMGVKDGARAPYYKARAQAEAELKSSGLPYVIARPGFITGPGRDDPRPAERIGASATDALVSLASLVAGPRFAARYCSTTNVELGHALVKLGLDPGTEDAVVEPEGLRLGD